MSSPTTTTARVPPRARPAGTAATGGGVRRPLRDNPLLILIWIGLLLAALAAMVTLADRSADLSPELLSEVVLYAVSVADLLMIIALFFVLARNILKLIVERRRALPFAQVPREAGDGAARHDADPGRARADRRLGADQEQREPLVQPADRSGAAQRARDRQRLLHGTHARGERTCLGHRAPARGTRPRGKQRHGDPRRDRAGSDAASARTDRGLSHRAARLAADGRAGRRCRVTVAAFGFLARVRRSAGDAHRGRLGQLRLSNDCRTAAS